MHKSRGSKDKEKHAVKRYRRSSSKTCSDELKPTGLIEPAALFSLKCFSVCPHSKESEDSKFFLCVWFSSTEAGPTDVGGMIQRANSILQKEKATSVISSDRRRPIHRHEDERAGAQHNLQEHRSPHSSLNMAQLMPFA